MKSVTLLIVAFLQCSVSVPTVNDSFELSKNEIAKLNGPLVGNREYVLLVAVNGDVIIIDASTYDEIAAYSEQRLFYKTVGVINDTFYYIDKVNGAIYSTKINNIVSPPQDGIGWDQVGSFSGGVSNQDRTNIVVNGTIFYFEIYIGIIYKYDTILKTVTKCGDLPPENNYDSVIVNGILYFHSEEGLYSFDGNTVSILPEAPLPTDHAVVFEFDGNICYAGGSISEKPEPMYCYDPEEKIWIKFNAPNEARQSPGVVRTQHGTAVFGGDRASPNDTLILLNSAEIFNHESELWSYIPTPPSMKPNWYSAVSFYF